MITVKLSKEDYNRLYLCAKHYSYIFCRKDNQYIYLTNGNYDIAQMQLSSKEGEILSHYTNCLLGIRLCEGVISLYKTCVTDDYYDCDNCGFYGCTYKCELGINQKLRKMREKVEDIEFVDPIPNRTSHMVENLEKWSKQISSIKKSICDNPDVEIQGIYNTVGILEEQLNGLLDEWEYEKKEYKIECESAKDKYLCVVFDHIEDARSGAKVAYLNELDSISRCIITALKTSKINISLGTAPFSKANLIKYACEECGCEEGEVEKTIQHWIEAGLMYETNLGNIGMRVLF